MVVGPRTPAPTLGANPLLKLEPTREARSLHAESATPEARILRAAIEKRLTATHPGGCVWREARGYGEQPGRADFEPGFEPVAEGDHVDF